MKIECANCGTAVELEGPPGHIGRCKCGNRLTVPARPVKEQFGVAHCTNCWKRYGVVGRPAGTRFKCKACGQMITIREPGKPAGAGVGAGSSRQAAPVQRKIPIELSETDEMDVAGVETARAPRRAPAGEAVSSSEIADLRAAVQRHKAAAEESESRLRRMQSELEEKERALQDKESELGRRAEEIRTLQERNTRQSAEIGALQQEISARVEELAGLKTRLEDVEKLLKIRDADLAARDERIKQLERELSERPSREETKKFYADKEDVEKRLSEGGAKLSALREAIARLREPLAEALKRFDELGVEAGAINLPDFTAELRKAKQEAEERRLAFAALRTDMDALKHEKEDIAAELERTRKDLAAARKASEDILKAAEEEIERLSSSATAAEERKGLLRGLFGGRKEPARPAMPKGPSPSTRFRLRAASALSAEGQLAQRSGPDGLGEQDAVPPTSAPEGEDLPPVEPQPVEGEGAAEPPADGALPAEPEEVAEAEPIEEVEEGELIETPDEKAPEPEEAEEAEEPDARDESRRKRGRRHRR